jgi:uncharacterized SAM-dependent methyltransferase
MLVGIDLKKTISVMQNAYNDASGVTAEFNLNLLQRINRELGADFDPNRFEFHCFYDPQVGCIKSFIISLDAVRVNIAGTDFYFDQYEAIHTEVSHKYSKKEIEKLAQDSGFQVQEWYFDARNYFADCLFVPA